MKTVPVLGVIATVATAAGGGGLVMGEPGESEPPQAASVTDAAARAGRSRRRSMERSSGDRPALGAESDL
ncbi:hypothetical protein rosag_19990 [Roseisolibacter agri]|uniref:Uncharacterized protein n=1 Tax=Roseisolibacter agri TaxID=2014610 RepID=A0AA37Q9C9_9BACT|nr:hypothetical protein rosag_19990 [Roseisolibacter agri]